MIDAGDSEVVQESPRESLFKDRYFVSWRGIGSRIAKRFKDPAQDKVIVSSGLRLLILVTTYHHQVTN